jgi:prenyltransferase beta subunit
LQNADGGFPNDFESDNPSSVKTTYRVVRTLTQIGIDKCSHTITAAINWLTNQQENDGGWHENPTITIPEWVTWESTTKSVTWYTCQIAMLLKELGMHETTAFRKAIFFFEKAQLPSGGWPPVVGQKKLDPDSTVGIGNFLAKIHSANHPSVLRAKKIFEERMSELAKKVSQETVDDAYELTHLIFDEVPNHMYNLSDERVRKILKMLVNAQRKDGGWKTFYSDGKSDVAITAYALQVLISHGILKKEFLQEMFDCTVEGC